MYFPDQSYDQTAYHDRPDITGSPNDHPSSEAEPQENRPIRVFVVDDHPVVRAGIQSILSPEPDIRLVQSADSVDDAVAKLDAYQPDVVLVDLDLGRQDGLSLLRYIQRTWMGMKTVVVTQHASALFAEKTRGAGAMGYVCKSELAEHIIDAIRSVWRDRLYFPGAGDKLQ
jgi:DNA-binding NarL/FixJ family response regulator